MLEQRIAENTAFQQIDLNQWIFERLSVRRDAHVLELCCGTGAQTVHFLKHIGESGSMSVVDISRPALDTLASRASFAAPKLTLLQARLDNFPLALRESRYQPPFFDLIFCAYGLYYAENARRVLQESLGWLSPGGRLVIIGPFGPNNQPVFNLVRESGATLSPAVLDSSERFMLETVLPWAAQNFESISVHTLVNRVRWTEAERVLNYWENTTFYDPAKRLAFERLLRLHFDQHGEFINEKWIMMAEMKDARN